MEPTKGKWWNDVDGQWVLTELEKEREAMLDIPEDDDDILGEAKRDAEEGPKPGDVSKSKVADTSYYVSLLNYFAEG